MTDVNGNMTDLERAAFRKLCGVSVATVLTMAIVSLLISSCIALPRLSAGVQNDYLISELILALVLCGVATLITLFLLNKFARPFILRVTKQRQFTEEMGHELATPISILRSRLQLMEKEFADTGAISQSELEVLVHATARMTALIDDFRLLAKSERGDRQSDLCVINADQMVRSVAKQFEPIMEQRRMTISLGKLDHAVVIGNVELLERVLSNILTNAARYGREGGSVTIALAGGKGAFQVSIRDDGPGIPADSLPHLFDRFYRVTTPEGTAIKGGTGLGLAIAKAIVEWHGGTIEVRSNVNVGTEFIIKLPTMADRHPALAFLGKT